MTRVYQEEQEIEVEKLEKRGVLKQIFGGDHHYRTILHFDDSDYVKDKGHFGEVPEKNPLQRKTFSFVAWEEITQLPL